MNLPKGQIEYIKSSSSIMFPYLIIIILVVISISYNRRMTKRLRLFNVLVVGTLISLIFGLRYRVGLDTINYMGVFDDIPDISSFFKIDWAENRYEPGFILLLIICKSIIKDFWFAQLIIAGLTTSFIFIFLYKHCRNPFIGILIYYILAMFYFSTEILRESLAIGIFLVNFRNYEKSNWVSYYLMCLLSLSFHYSSIILFFFPLVKYLKVNVLYITTGVAFFLIAPLLDILNDVLAITSIASRVGSYILQAEGVNLNFRLFFLIQLLPPALYTVVLSYKQDKDTLIMKFILLHLLFCCGVFAIPIIFSRFTNYTLLFVIVGVSNLLCRYSLKKITRTLLFSITLFSQILYYNHNYNRWYPYVSIFNPIKVEIRENRWWYEFGQYF